MFRKRIPTTPPSDRLTLRLLNPTMRVSIRKCSRILRPRKIRKRIWGKGLRLPSRQRTKALADIQLLRQDIADLQSSRDKDANQIAQLKAHSEQDQNAAISAQAQIRSLKEAEDSKNADLVATQIQLRDLEGKLADQRAVGGERTDIDRSFVEQRDA